MQNKNNIASLCKLAIKGKIVTGSTRALHKKDGIAFWTKKYEQGNVKQIYSVEMKSTYEHPAPRQTVMHFSEVMSSQETRGRLRGRFSHLRRYVG